MHLLMKSCLKRNQSILHVRESYSRGQKIIYAYLRFLCTLTIIVGFPWPLITANIYVYGSPQLAAIVTPNDVADKTVSWVSDNITIATMDKNGMVTGISQGNTKITATTRKSCQKASCTVTVKPCEGNITPVTAAIPVNDFLNSIGVCSTISKRGENLQSTIACAKYLGIRWFRAGYESDIPVSDLIELHHHANVCFSYGLGSGGNDLQRLLDGAKQLASAGALLALEGNNEPNNWGVTYQGETGGRDLSWVPIAKLQRDLYRSVKNDPALKDYPVWNISESGAQTDNVGLQFLTIQEGANTSMPAGTMYADYANCHNYIVHPGWQGIHDNQTWIASDPGPECKVDGLYGNYGLTWLNKYPGYSVSELMTLPRITTETGVAIDTYGVDEELQGKLFMNLYLSQFKRGWSYTSIYLLRDRTDESGNQQYGFYKPDYTPRQAAHYLHNLTTILADAGSISSPGVLNYSIPCQPVTVHDMLLQKSNGKFYLVVWGEQYSGSSNNVSINLDSTYSFINIYDPTIGTSMVQTLNNVSSATISITDHPLIIEI